MIFIRKPFLKKFTRGSLVIALIFSLNAFLFFFLEKKLKNNLNQYEGQLAVRNALFIDQDRINIIEKEALDCRKTFPSQCKNYSSELIRYYNRLKDLIIVFSSDPFFLPEKDPLMINLQYTRDAIGAALVEIFSLPLVEAVSKDISTPAQYGSYISQSVSLVLSDNGARSIADLGDVLGQNTSFIKSWSENKLYYLPKIESKLYVLITLLRLMFVAQILIYIIASAVDYWLNNIPLGESVGWSDRASLALVFKTKRSKPLLFAIFAGLVSILMSQKILSLETERMISNNCRTINRNSVSVNNIMTSRISSKAFVYSDLPRYCDQFIGIELESRLLLLKSRSNFDEINSQQIRLYADHFSALESSQLEESQLLALLLISFNVLTISLQLVKLDIENDELD